MQPLLISPTVRSKLRAKHHVTEAEILQCLEKGRVYFIDDRAEHATDPPTLWLVEKTKRGRSLKVIFVIKDGLIHLKSAYDADKKIVDLYHAKYMEFLLLGGLA